MMKGDAAVGAHGLRDLGELFEHLIDAITITMNYALVQEFKRKIPIRLNKRELVEKFGKAIGMAGDPKTKGGTNITVPVLENETH